VKQFPYRRKHRLKGRLAYSIVYARRCSAADANMIVFVHRNSVGHPRLGLSVGRKHGNAVARNLRKRLLREAFRLSMAELPPNFDVICVPRIRDDPSLAGYMNSLPRLMRQAVARWDRHEDFDVGRERLPG
jgi:ribonuclease P protein component